MIQSTSIYQSKKDNTVLNFIIRNYNPLDYTPRLKLLLAMALPSHDLRQYQKYDLHKLLGDYLIKNRQGEELLKYCLFQEFKNKRLVAAYEMKVEKSRVDFLTINRVSTSFEIKSGLDNLDKLSKQALDYLQVFEYNNVIIDSCHLQKALKILPESFGIWIYKGSKKNIFRAATLNNEINPVSQLTLLTKKELNKAFGESSKTIITELFSRERINIFFKKMLKERYYQRWSFIVEHAPSILPMDVQFFFNTNIDPKHIYQY